MGLDISHNTWHGAYSAFHRWRKEIAKVSGLPPLELMEGFYSDETFALLNLSFPNKEDITMYKLRDIMSELPIKWESLKLSPLHELLFHSDCDGEIEWQHCNPIADELEKLLPLLEGLDGGGHIGSFKEKTQQFINGLRDAASLKENIEFR